MKSTPAFLTPFKADIETIENALRRNLKAHLDIVEDVAGHILFSGGKRIRPLLMTLSAKTCGHQTDEAAKFSTIFEYMHVASLLHDDLVDDASLRRGNPVAHKIWGNEIAVLVGDFLLARVLSLCADTRRMEIIRVLSEITEEMSQGEIHQLIRKGKIDIAEEEYMEVIRRKTAVLIEGACRVGAIFGDGTEKQISALSSYGLNLGVAFQIADDILDYASATDTLGKEVGADLREGKITLPLIHALGRSDPLDKKTMVNIIRNPTFSGEDFRVLKDILKKYDGLDYARERALYYAGCAKKALDIFPATPAVQCLIELSEYAVKRKL